MIRTNICVVVFCFLLLLLLGCADQSKSSSTINPVPMDTPASQKCVHDGGQDKMVYGPDGQHELCLFSDGSVCEQSAYFQGTCAKGACIRKCDAIGTRSEGWYDCNGKLLFWDKCSNETAVTAGTC